MILGIPLYRLLIWAVLILVLGSVATKIQWGNFGKAAQVVSAQYPTGEETPAPWFESTDARRSRLKNEAVEAGKALLADICDEGVAQKFRNTLISLARQRMRDMGCLTDMFCNVEKGFKEVSFRLYASDADRQISHAFYAAMRAGSIPLGNLGVYQFFVGHPEEMISMNTITMKFSGEPCVATPQAAN